MDDRRNKRLTDAELHAFFDRLFPHGFAGVDVLTEIAPKGWEQSPLHACFHPSVEQRHQKAVEPQSDWLAARVTAPIVPIVPSLIELLPWRDSGASARSHTCPRSK